MVSPLRLRTPVRGTAQATWQMTKGLAPWGLPLDLPLWSAWGIPVRAEPHMVSFTFSFCPKSYCLP